MVTERLVLNEERKSELVNQHISRYVFAGGFVSGKRVLDVACGSGYGTKLLSEAGASSTLGVDISTDALVYANRHYPGDNISFAQGDAEAMQVNGPFDVIVSYETIEHLQNPERFLAETIRLLSETGTLIISTPIRVGENLLEKPRNPFHVREWSVDEFTTLLRTFYERVDVYAQHNFRKNAVPYSRSMKRLFTRVMLPRVFKTINEYSVLAECPKYAWFRMDPVYMVVVCRKST